MVGIPMFSQRYWDFNQRYVVGILGYLFLSRMNIIEPKLPARKASNNRLDIYDSLYSSQ